jgi:hypothetical protein
MVSTGTLDAEIGVVIIAIFVVLVGVYGLYRYLKRRGPELAAREAKSVLDDRSYNQIRLGQAAADRLERTGVDVTAAREYFRRAEAARAGGNFQGAIDLAKQGQDSLAKSRSDAGGFQSPAASLSSAPLSRTPGVASAAARPVASAAFAGPPTAPFVAGGLAGGAELGSDPEPTPDRPPKNKMEAHFQLSVLHDELEQARPSKSGTQGFRDALALNGQGQAAYDKQDFTEALRLALKSRRTLGTRVEGLPVTAVAKNTSTTSESAAAMAAARSSGTGDASPTFGQKCAKCGRTAAGTDQFCRGCGAPIAPAQCAGCGTPLLAGDRFCGKCGATQALPGPGA